MLVLCNIQNAVKNVAHSLVSNVSEVCHSSSNAALSFSLFPIED